MNAGEILLYQTEDGRSRIDVRLVNDTIWLSAGQIGHGVLLCETIAAT